MMMGPLPGMRILLRSVLFGIEKSRTSAYCYDFFVTCDANRFLLLQWKVLLLPFASGCVQVDRAYKGKRVRANTVAQPHFVVQVASGDSPRASHGSDQLPFLDGPA